MADDTTVGAVFFVTVTVCPATAADGRVTEAVVITNLAADTVVMVTAGLLLATELCVPCTTFCGDSCEVLTLTGDAPVS